MRDPDTILGDRSGDEQLLPEEDLDMTPLAGNPQLISSYGKALRSSSKDEETKRILRPTDASFGDTGLIRQFVSSTLLEGTEAAEATVTKRGKKKHELRYDFCVDQTLERVRQVGHYSNIILPEIFERIKDITKTLLPIVIGQILEKYKRYGLKEGDLQIDDQGRITIPDKKVIKIRRNRLPFSSRFKKGKARSVLRLDEEIRDRYMAVARPSLRNLAKETAQNMGVPESLLEKFSDRYLILGKVRENRSGTLYLARDIETNELVALKVVCFLNDSIKQRYHQESQMLEILNHERIPQFVDANETEEGGYLVMEWIDGVNLSTYLGKEGFLPLSAKVNESGEIERIGVMELAIQLASTLHGIHSDSPQVIHRDLSPTNVLVANGGDILLTDFGISSFRSKKGKLDPIQSYTPAYASPEALLEEPFDERTDVYSLGLLLYQALTGRLPHGSEDVSSTSTESAARIMTNRMRGKEIPPVSSLRPETPPELAGLVMQCLEDSDKRPEVGALLEGFLGIYEHYFETSESSQYEEGDSDYDGEIYTSAPEGVLVGAA